MRLCIMSRSPSGSLSFFKSTSAGRAPALCCTESKLQLTRKPPKSDNCMACGTKERELRYSTHRHLSSEVAGRFP